ncbi:1-aminocyclopropane-1-carboxylate oxidase homolog 1-like [Mangifera indica]|uniref:1-aminocyclopropane-1-carboxylate oxidase homolog 1-like n=1 Tax=Mangifera indica TaxID=29780 RepID=UPI001CF950DF|nr:1-aminocyclopropane-1-carboxylate oxidase homolog 1-like [Mangifera indica]
MNQNMDMSNASKPSDYERAKELKSFDDTKAGVKGLVDSGIVKIPRIFIRPADELAEEELTSHQHNFQVPVVDLDGIKDDRLQDIVDEIRVASETWGFFQVVNHGIPLTVLEEMLHGARRFHEQDLGVKKELYSRDPKRDVRFYSNLDLLQSPTANWRDTLAISTLASKQFNLSEIPEVCRDSSMAYIKSVSKLENTLFELLSMALALKPEHLKEMGCTEGFSIACHYYASCPQPDLTLGATKHSDPSFLTIVLQDQIGGLQVFHENQWVDVEPVAGGLVVNIGDFLQVISNNKFKSVDHRVVANGSVPSISAACFFTGHATGTPKLYGPIKELTSEENPPVYRDFLISEHLSLYFARAVGDKSVLYQFKL